MASSRWATYLSAAVSVEQLVRSRAKSAPALADQRAVLSRLCRALHPKRVGCLGAGYLNDIPLTLLFSSDVQTYLVDWIPGISRTGLAGHLISQQADTYSCLICREDCNPLRYCTAYRSPARRPTGVCSNFAALPGPVPQCENFAPGEEPQYLAADITLGRASHFGERAEQLVATAKTPLQAFRQAINACRESAGTIEPLPIDDHSLDLVISSLVVSQFDHEPYNYFAGLLEARFGRETLLRKEHELRPLMERFRSNLFRIQVEGHVRELYRLVETEGGKVYLSVELFRRLPEGDDFFLVQEMPVALETIDRYFRFSFKTLPADQAFRTIGADAGTSILQCYLLTPRASPERSADPRLR